MPCRGTLSEPGLPEAPVQQGGDLQDAVPRLGPPLRPHHQEGRGRFLLALLPLLMLTRLMPTLLMLTLLMLTLLMLTLLKTTLPMLTLLMLTRLMPTLIT